MLLHVWFGWVKKNTRFFLNLYLSRDGGFVASDTMAHPVIYVQTRGGVGPPVEVNYFPNMPFYRYLRDVLAPACRSPTLHQGCTVAERFSYDGPIGRIFNRENRMEFVGNFIPAGATLTRIPDRGGSETLHGNAVAHDITQPCAICQGTVDGFCDYGLECCSHRFHAVCMLRSINHRTPERCPVCRRDFTVWDRAVIWMVRQVQRPW